LQEVLTRAATTVPHYREQWAARQRAGDCRTWDELEHWPILEKHVLREHPRRLLADDSKPSHMVHEQTSGTTGTPLNLWRSRQAIQQLYALSDGRERGWSGVSLDEPWAMLGGQLVAAIEQRRPPFWVWNKALNQLYMSAYHLDPVHIPDYLDALVQHRIGYVWGYTSALYALAYGALQAGRNDLAMKVAITNAEPVSAHQRQVIGDAFKCPVRETYGMAEMAFAATECERGRLHAWPELGVLEVLDENDRPVRDGQTGEFVVTGLLNAGMPLIRYRVGDRGAMAPGHTPCACGRTLPIVARVEGRADDVLYTAHGASIGRLDPVFKADLPIVEAQVIQEALTRVRVRVVTASGFDRHHERAIVQRLKDRIGPIDVVLEQVDVIPRTARGKFRAVVCALSATERDIVRRAAVQVPAGRRGTEVSA